MNPAVSRDAVDGLRQQFSGVVVGPEMPATTRCEQFTTASLTSVPHRPDGDGIPAPRAWFQHGAVYVNYLAVDEPDRIRAAYGPNWGRLVALKRRWDPDNVFHLNQNIDPSS
jgi:hypothetical protein